ncbi:MAG: PadR family transcriptional regulator [Bacteroidetes bacterium]|nr:PadR family transcriptional regulator [Bacteroidota bacterium]
MESLTRKEELILLAIINLEEEAYLVSIQDHLSSVLKMKMLLTAVHVPLTRLEKRGLIESEYGESTAVRGGRRKKIYTLTDRGLKTLNEYRKINDIMWDKYSKGLV